MNPTPRAEPTVAELLEGFGAGRIGSLARAISWVEDDCGHAGELLDALYEQTGRAWRTGLTGPPGAGKSTLTDALVRHWAGQDRRAALIAVDPSSPFTGGALLGDRVRMDQSLLDAGVYVRSMANRGSLGGMALATGAAADLCDAFGFPEVVLETVGVGQAEVDVMSATDVAVVVLTPQSGDGIQAMKAGLMEVGDLFVVNKSDCEGADRLKHEIEGILDLRQSPGLLPEVVTCSAKTGDGVAQVADAIERRRVAMRKDGLLEARRNDRALARIRRLVDGGVRAQLWANANLGVMARAALADGGRPDAIAGQLLADVLKKTEVSA